MKINHQDTKTQRKEKKRIFLFFFVSLCLCGLFVFLHDAYGYNLEKEVHEFRLPNGMRWMLVERHQAPVFSGIVMIRVGGADETPGKTGLAHMFEHMAFKGSSKLGTSDFEKEKPILGEIERVGDLLTKEKQNPAADPAVIKKLEAELARLTKEASRYQIKNEVWEVMARNGAADLNAYTSKDVTAYHASVPINRLELWMDVISQMISDPVYREFYTERSVILEERRAGIENDPDGKMTELILKSAFAKGPYNWLVIGQEKDVAGLTIADARSFHEQNYVADKMVGVLVGDLDIGEAKRLIKEYFGPIKASKKLMKDASFQNKGGGSVKFDFDAEPAVAISYHKPTLPNPDEFVLDVITSLLCAGPVSRLEKRLIYDEKVARDVDCSDSFPGSRFENLFLVWVEPNMPHTTDEMAVKVNEELERLKREAVSDEELSRIRKKITAAFIYALESNMGLAMLLAEYETTFNDWRLITLYPKKIEQVTKEDVMRAAEKYLTAEGETEVVRLRGPKKR